MRLTVLTLALVLTSIGCGLNETPQPERAPTLPACVPNRTGGITADEMPIAIGATQTYYAGANRTVDQDASDGVWDLSEERADDDVIGLGPVALRDQWFASMFPAGQFVVDAGSGQDGIYHQDDRALWLDGIASHEEAPAAGKTLIVYPTPLATLRFPVQVGDAFTESVPIMATINGLPLNGTDELSVEVADEAELDVPYVRFDPVLRVRTLAVRRPSTGGSASRRTTIYLFECFGEVARAESKPDETDPDFATAAYTRRFALGVTP
jgi:hypothetical protein